MLRFNLLSDDGSIYLWGCNDTSQLGSGMKSKKSKSIPTRIQYNGDLPKCIVTGGKECTGFCFVVTRMIHNRLNLLDSGTTYSWGNNDHGELGIGDRKQRAAPQRVTSLTDITAIACGVTHSISLDSKVINY
jgi:alpha-tubulin suppressor-like RCC1 family protein